MMHAQPVLGSPASTRSSLPSPEATDGRSVESHLRSGVLTASFPYGPRRRDEAPRAYVPGIKSNAIDPDRQPAPALSALRGGLDRRRIMSKPPTIEKVETILVDLPTIRPHELSMTTMRGQTLMIVRIVASDGVVGL